jgi:drug/metabolite transporter (DMT)-like permease
VSDIASSVLCGLVAAACWGVADFLARDLSQGLGAFRAQLWSQLVGMVALGVAVVVVVGTDGVGDHVGGDVGGSAFAAISLRTWLFTAAYAVISSAGILCFFVAFGSGPLAVVAPIVGAYGAVTVAWSVLDGAVLTMRTLVGLTVVMAGVMLASVPARNADRPAGHMRGVVAAMAAALLFGTAFFIMGREVVPQLGALLPTFIARLLGPILLVTLATLSPTSTGPIGPPPRALWSTVLWSGLLSSIAVVATGLGSRGGQSAIAAVTGSMSVVVTVMISMVLLREQLARHQWAGAMLALAGVLALT